MNEEERRELRRAWSRIVRAGWRIAFATDRGTGRRVAHVIVMHSRPDAQLYFNGPDLLSVIRAAADTVGLL